MGGLLMSCLKSLLLRAIRRFRGLHLTTQVVDDLSSSPELWWKLSERVRATHDRYFIPDIGWSFCSALSFLFSGMESGVLP
jgi:hypothetical protein